MCDPVSIGLGAASIIGGISSSKGAKKAQKEANAIARETLNFAKQRYSDFKTTYGDLEQMVVAGAKKGVVADLAGVTSRAIGDVATQFTNAEASQARANQRMGINPNSGRAESMGRQTALSKALATAGNVTTNREAERRNAEQETWNRRTAVNTQGINQMNLGASEVNNANNTLMNNYNNTAAQKSAQAGAFFGMAGQAAGMGLAGMGKTTPTAVAQTSGVPTTNVAPSPVYTNLQKANAQGGFINTALSGGTGISGLSAANPFSVIPNQSPYNLMAPR